MSGCVDEPDGGLAQLQLVSVVKQSLYWGHSSAYVQSELCCHGWHVAIGLLFVDMEDGFDAECAIDKGQTEGVVEMAVSLQDILQLELVCTDATFQQLLFVTVPTAWVEDGCFEGFFVPEEVGVLLNGVACKGDVFHWKLKIKEGDIRVSSLRRTPLRSTR